MKQSKINFRNTFTVSSLKIKCKSLITILGHKIKKLQGPEDSAEFGREAL